MFAPCKWSQYQGINWSSEDLRFAATELVLAIDDYIP
jgi:hypothetical protein